MSIMTCFLILKIITPLVICIIQVLPEIGYQLLHSYSEQIKDWGWICNIHAQNSESFKRYACLVFLQKLLAFLDQCCQKTINVTVFDYLRNGPSYKRSLFVHGMYLRLYRVFTYQLNYSLGSN